ncbi:MAG: hypothetical protein ACKOD2_00100, partial [Ilumatobacteraceae bacterium]
MALEVTTEDEDGVKSSVPVTMVDSRRRHEIESLPTGDEVPVLGRERRRVFDTGAGTASRTEVGADALVRPTQRARQPKSL